MTSFLERSCAERMLDSVLDSVPGTLFLKTLDSNRYLAIPVELLDFVPGTDGNLSFKERVRSCLSQ